MSAESPNKRVLAEMCKEFKVGFVVLVLLLVMALLALRYSGANAVFHKSFTIILRTSNSGGIRKKSAVMMSGVPVGTVSALKLDPDGANVSIYLSIYGQFKIREDAHFFIEQNSLFSDQFVAIHPGASKGEPFTNGSMARVEEPFNLLKAAQSGSGVIKSGDEIAKKIDETLSDFRRRFLSEENLTNFSHQIAARRQDAVDLRTALDQVNSFMKTSTIPASIGALTTSIQKWDGYVESANAKLNSNAPQIAARLAKFQADSANLSNQLGAVQQGKGTAGAIFESQATANDISNLTARLAADSININREGLWHALLSTNKSKP